MYCVKPIDQASARAYAQLAGPELRPLLDQVGAHPALLAIGATLLDRPAGLALATLGDDGVAHLEDVYTAPAFRAAGVGAQILSALEQAAWQRGCGQIQAFYRTNTCL